MAILADYAKYKAFPRFVFIGFRSESSDLGQCNHSVARLITNAATSIVGNHFFKPVQSAWANIILA
jgi:hypothetical protein